MNRALFPLIGLGIVAAIVGGALYSNRGSHVVLDGQIQKVRTHSVDERSSAAIIDFRFVNPARYPFVVRDVELFLVGKDGKETPGMVVSDIDAKRLLDAVPELGPKYNDTLKVRDKVMPKQSDDRMVAARFEVPEADLQARARFRIRVEDVDGAVSEILEGGR
jgi:hypothetical protein